MKRSLGYVSLTAVLVLAAAGCGGSSSEGEPDNAAPASGAAIPGGGLTIAGAMATSAQGPLLVAGYLVEQDGELRLCSEVLESDPLQCGEPSLEVHGDVGGAEVGERVSLIGDVEGGVLTVSENTQA